jgi:hypothetical protein
LKSSNVLITILGYNQRQLYNFCDMTIRRFADGFFDSPTMMGGFAANGFAARSDPDTTMDDVGDS